MADCDRAPCVLVAAYEAGRFDEIMAVKWLSPTDAPTVNVLIKNEILVMLCESWFLRSGHFRRKRGENSAIAIYQAALKQVMSAADALGLNPAARQRLGIGKLKGATLAEMLARSRNGGGDTDD